jgi:type II secretory pathway pseudopilin PulG
MGTLKFLLITWLKRSSKTAQKVGGFTLLELLVGLVLAFLIITPLLGFVINIMNTDRQEQAKSNSEQEIQSAMEYISRDLQQAVYIYDKFALANDYSAVAAESGIRDQLPQVTNGEPVLVFWKRKLIEKALPTANSGPCPRGLLNAQCNDTYVYSLVGYYLIKGNTTPANSPWSSTARIGRFEIQDGVTSPQDPDNPIIQPDDGFQLFSLSKSGTIAQSMNQWQKNGNPAPDKLPQNNILIDYIDQTPTTVDADPVPFEACPADSNPLDTDPEWAQVPSTSETFSFYACVWSAKNTARVYIRGNALARIQPSNNIPTYTAGQSSFFPKARIEVKSRATLGSNS